MNQRDEARYELSLIRHTLKIGLAEGGYVRNLMALIKQVISNRINEIVFHVFHTHSVHEFGSQDIFCFFSCP